MLLGATAIFFLIRHYGEMLAAPPPAPTISSEVRIETTDAGHIVFHVLLVLAAVVATGRLIGILLVRFRQPPVIGEVVAGILLGPSFLGRVAPAIYNFLLPSSIAPVLNAIAQAGIILYMFLVGLELNADRVRSRAHATVATSHASIVLPFVLGSALALYLYPRLSTIDVSFTSFALFMGIAMSITAFPVLARILADRGMSHSELGTVALTCAAVDDVTSWCLLALVVGVARGTPEGAATVAALTLAFIGITFLLVRPAVVRLLSWSGDQPRFSSVVLALAGMAASALATARIGVHAIFGAFLFGAIFPHDKSVAHASLSRLKGFVTVALLPAFFALAGMRTRIDLVSGAAEWLICGLIILVATVGKFGGTFIAARVTGMSPGHAAALGILMNTRGLMELFVLNIGLDLAVISLKLFTMMVLMALVTTMATTPVVDRLVPGMVRYNPRS